MVSICTSVQVTLKYLLKLSPMRAADPEPFPQPLMINVAVPTGEVRPLLGARPLCMLLEAGLVAPWTRRDAAAGSTLDR